jgi:tetratricopeptide (TPR) repeat protein
MRSRRADRAYAAAAFAAAAIGAVLLVAPLVAAAAQSPTPTQWLSRGFDYEDAGKLDSAAAAFRRAIAAGERQQGLLGLERVLTLAGRRAELVAVADSVITAQPADFTAYGVKLRALSGNSDRVAFRSTLSAWATRRPTDADPWRDAARALLDAGQPAAADSVLGDAIVALGATRGIASEQAQVHVRLGRFEQAARSFREAMRDSPWLLESAVYALRSTPPERRTATVNGLLAPPTGDAARRAAAALRLGWGDPAAAWAVLKGLAKSDSTAEEWETFGARARAMQAPLIARDALVSALEIRRRAPVALDAADASLDAGDAPVALDLVDLSRLSPDTAGTGLRRAVVRVRALAMAGRLSEAAREVAALRDPLARRRAAAALAEGHALAGDLATAARVADAEGLTVEDDAAATWVAFWRGDFATARRGLSAFTDGRRPAARAMSLLTRTSVATAPVTGGAFLLLARGDSLGAQTAFERAASELPDASAFVLLEAARLADARRDLPASARLWEMLIQRDRTSPEAAEARLARARSAIRNGEPSKARVDLEALILDQPSSALVPQARRELERLGARP